MFDLRPQFQTPLADLIAKWVSADGHREVVFGSNGDRVESNLFRGTFNFYGPDNGFAHSLAEILPWIVWGN